MFGRNPAHVSDLTLADVLASRAASADASQAKTSRGFFRAFQPKMSRPKALYALIAGAAAADGQFAAEEKQELIALANRTRTLSRLSNDRKDVIRRTLESRLAVKKLPELMEHAARSLPKEMRLAAFGHACDLVFADKMLLRSERVYLQRLMELLQLGDAEAESMVKAIRAKNAH